MPGTLIVKPQYARLTHDTDTFSRMDPYCTVKIGSQSQSTKVCEKGGKNPNWGTASFSFRITSEDIVNIEVWDKDLISKNDLIGEGSLAIPTIISGGPNCSLNCPLFYKGKAAGEVYLQFEWYSDAGAGQQGFGMPPGGYVHPPPQNYPPGYQMPAPGYQQPAPGYQQPAPGYQQPAPGHIQQQPGPGYQQQPGPGYQQPAAGGYQQQPPGPSYQKPGPGYQQPGGPAYQQSGQGGFGGAGYGAPAYGVQGGGGGFGGGIGGGFGGDFGGRSGGGDISYVGEWFLGSHITKHHLKKHRDMAFYRFDRDGSGYLSHKELYMAVCELFMMMNHPAPPQSYVNMVMYEYGNADGRMSHKEFKKFTKHLCKFDTKHKKHHKRWD